MAKPTLGALPEEDDDFDEFNEEDWDEFAKDVADANDVWEETWDNPEEDDFTRHLREELHKRLAAQAPDPAAAKR